MSTDLSTLLLLSETRTPSRAQKQVLPSPKPASQGRALFAAKASLEQFSPPPLYLYL